MINNLTKQPAKPESYGLGEELTTIVWDLPIERISNFKFCVFN